MTTTISHHARSWVGEPWARQPSVTEVPPEEQRPKAPARCAPRGCGVQPFLEEEAKGHIAESDGFFSSVLFPSESLALFLTYVQRFALRPISTA